MQAIITWRDLQPERLCLAIERGRSPVVISGRLVCNIPCQDAKPLTPSGEATSRWGNRPGTALVCYSSLKIRKSATLSKVPVESFGSCFWIPTG